MLDSITSTLTMTAAWQDHLSYGDIVSFRFPLAEEGHTGRPKARPCLVLDIETHGGERYALLAYGTTSRRRSNIGYEVHVRRKVEYLSAGLNEPTRFVGARRLLVPLDHNGFVICGGTGARARPPRRQPVRRNERRARPHSRGARHRHRPTRTQPEGRSQMAQGTS